MILCVNSAPQHSNCYIIIEQQAATPKFLNIEFLYSYLPTITHNAWDSRICKQFHTIKRYLRISCILQMSSHVSNTSIFFHSHTSETIKFYEKKILGACVPLSSNSLIADMFRIMGPVIQKIDQTSGSPTL